MVWSRAQYVHEQACRALAELAQCELHVHTKDNTQPTLFCPLNVAASLATVHLAYYCAEGWCHYRSTRPLQATPPASPAGGPAPQNQAPPSPGPSSVNAADVLGNAADTASGTDHGAAAAASQPVRVPINSRMSRTLRYGDEASGNVAPPYVAREHPATNAVIERHTLTVHQMHRDGISATEDKDDMLLKMVLYDTLPPRPDGDGDAGHPMGCCRSLNAPW